MEFKAYPPNSDSPYVFYVVGMQGVKISRRSNVLQISGADAFTKRRIEIFLRENNIDLTTLGIRSLHASLLEAGLLSSGRSRTSGSFTRQQQTSGHGQTLSKTPQQLIDESNRLKIDTCQFRKSTIDNVSVIVSSNEVPALAEMFHQSALKHISVAHLPVADIVATNMKTGDTLFIERKTTNDLHAAVTTNQRSHDQSERLFDAVNELRKQGVRARAIWLVEAQNANNVMLHSSLPIMQGVDGLINYFDMINDQSVHQTFSMNHTVYVAAKYIQGFFEQKLYKSVQSKNPSIMRSYKDRVAAKTILPTDERDSGVTRHTSTELAQMLSYIPSVSTAIAKELASTGRSFAEVLQMTEDELLSIKGIGKQTAQNIFRVFNARQDF